MIFGYKNDKYLGCSTDTETLEKALKMAGIDTADMEISDKPPEPSEPPEPTKEEKLAILDAQYEADKDKLRKAYQDAMIYGDTDRMESIKADLAALDTQYDEDYAAIESEGDDDE